MNMTQLRNGFFEYALEIGCSVEDAMMFIDCLNEAYSLGIDWMAEIQKYYED